ncbi:hypothetical protein FACS1894109_11030 [Spirochaetia bacterium]|nr:hypothetical protein FACS1894109_11030 [Spirochaetia bacterium]
MNNYYVKGTSEKLIALHLRNYQRIIDLAPAIIAVVQKFDGKQANKRLETALKEVDKNLFVKFDHDWHYEMSVEIQLYYEDRYVMGKADSQGVGNAYYIKDTCGTVCNAYQDNHPVVDGKFQAAPIVKHINENVESLVKLIKEAGDQLKQVDDLRRDKKEIEKRIESHNASLCWLVDAYFELSITK